MQVGTRPQRSTGKVEATATITDEGEEVQFQIMILEWDVP